MEEDIKFIKVGNMYEYPVGISVQDSIEITKSIAYKLEQVFPDRHKILWCRGSSGAMLSYGTAMIIPVYRIIHIKKEGEYAHYAGIFVNNFPVDAVNIIMDDFISTGDTVNTIWSFMEYYHIKCDCLCVTGEVDVRILKFKPSYIFCYRQRGN
jgi:hypothetical protein